MCCPEPAIKLLPTYSPKCPASVLVSKCRVLGIICKRAWLEHALIIYIYICSVAFVCAPVCVCVLQTQLFSTRKGILYGVVASVLLKPVLKRECISLTHNTLHLLLGWSA